MAKKPAAKKSAPPENTINTTTVASPVTSVAKSPETGATVVSVNNEGEKKKSTKKTMLGGKAVEVEMKPRLKTHMDLHRPLSEMNTAIVVWGRMNPPTVGHQRLVEAACDLAVQHEGIAFLALSRTESNKENPLPYNTKLDLVERAFEDLPINVLNESSIYDPISLAKYFSGKYENLVIVTGDDQEASYTRLFSEYNHKEFDFEHIYLVPLERAGQNLAETVSASQARNYVRLGDQAKFAECLPAALLSEARVIFAQISVGQVLAESKAKVTLSVLNKVLMEKRSG